MVALAIVLFGNGAAVARATSLTSAPTVESGVPSVQGGPRADAPNGAGNGAPHSWARTTVEDTAAGATLGSPPVPGAMGAGTPAACGADDPSRATTCAGSYHHGPGGDHHGHDHRHRHRGHESDVEIVLNPPSATNPVGTPDTVTATLTDKDGPVVGEFVDFEVSGANAGASGTCAPADCTTDDTGTVLGTYIGVNAGVDTITATISSDGKQRTASATETWTSAPPTSTTTTTTSTTTTTTTTTTPPPPTTTTTTTTPPPPPPTTTTTPTPPPNPPDIFQVELRNCTYLHVGYNRFPDGVVVRWNVTQDKATVSTGQFTTEGGGKKYHFLMLPLSATLQPKPKGTAHFHWFANGTKSSYTAGRETGC